MKYEKLFSKLQIAGVELKNRIVMAPMHDGLGGTGGDVSPRVIEYYAARARGGVGLIINGFTVVCPDELAGTACPGQSHLETLDNRNSFQYLAERLHEYGTKLFIQLHHPGREVYAPKELNGGRQPVSCTELPRALVNMPKAAPAHELTVEEIQRIEDCFAKAAYNAFSAGTDGVEVHCAHGYLFSQFITPYKNERTDEYGGSTENRCRIVTETLDKIRAVVPRSFPVSCRINGIEGDGRPDGIFEDLAYMTEVSKLLVAHGADMLDVSIGGIECICSPEVEAGSRSIIINTIKNAVNVPVAAVNVIKTPQEAEKLLEDDIQDLVMLGRQMIADPDWAEKARAGREEDIRPCLSCNNCIHQSSGQKPVRCAINPYAGREVDDNSLKPASGDMLVIGAGPAGIEAALTGAAKGYRVTLMDRRPEIGGSLQLANKAPGKFRIDLLIEYYKRQLAKQPNIELRLGCNVTEDKLEELAAEKPALVVLAAGGKPIVPKLPGVERAVLAHDVLSGKVRIEGKRVVVIGGGMTGIETAELLMEENDHVAICELRPMLGIGSFIYTAFKYSLLLGKAGADIRKNCMVTEIGADSVSYKDVATGAIDSIPVDVAVLALGVTSDKALLSALEARFENVVNLGDSSRPGNICSAVSDGFHRVKGL